MTVRIEPQPFDAGIVGAPVYRAFVDGPADAGALETAIPADAVLVSLRVPAEDADAFRGGRWREIETLITLERPLRDEEAGDLPPGVRHGCADDAEACGELAVRAFEIDRLHADPEIDDAIAEAAKRAWAANNARGRADTALLAVDEDGRIVGFNFLLVRGGRPVIDLIAVDPERQGRGLGRRLVDAAIRVYARRAPAMLIGTQASNLRALATYERAGFRPTARHVTFHFTSRRIGRAA